MIALVTGCAGFIGSTLTDALLGWEPRTTIVHGFGRQVAWHRRLVGSRV